MYVCFKSSMFAVADLQKRLASAEGNTGENQETERLLKVSAKCLVFIISILYQFLSVLLQGFDYVIGQIENVVNCALGGFFFCCCCF